MDYIEKNCKPSTHTLGGGYNPPETGESDLFGPIDFDPHLDLTVLSQHQSEVRGDTLLRDGDVFTLKFKNCPVKVKLTWIEDILAGSLEEVVQYFVKLEDKRFAYAAWSSFARY